jgi:hypothetical protein
MTDAFPTIHHQAAPEPKLTECFVFGERNSGTNLASELLRRNFPAFADSASDRIGPHGFRYGWKHGFPQMLAAPASTLAIALFRGPETWLRSMHKRPWHAAPALRGLEFPAFIRAQWVSRVDERNFGVTDDDPRALKEMQWDRHPLTGARFANICKLRRAKNQGFLSLRLRFVNCLFIRHEDLTADPEGFVSLVSRHYGVTPCEGFQPVEHRRGRQAEGRFQSTTYAALDQSDHVFVWSQLDKGQEEQLGYLPAP